MSYLSPPFYCAELAIYAPGNTGGVQLAPSSLAPMGLLSQAPGNLNSFEQLTVSDVGYRTASTDAQGIVTYPAVLAGGVNIDRQVPLAPSAVAAGVAWGSVVLSNAGQNFDSIVQSRNNDARNVRLLTGQKVFDETRGLYLDPAYSALSLLFQGIGTMWMLDETQLTIPLRDGSYFIENPLQQKLYAGTGGLAGTATLAGLPVPMARGGAASSPICNVTPVLVDPPNRIYQYTDFTGTVVNLYEGGDTNITFQSDVANLYSSSTAPGQYRTCNALGLFQLGSTNVRQITADVTGQFATPVFGNGAAGLALQMLIQDCMLPNTVAEPYLDANSFTNFPASPWPCGVWYGPTPVDGITAVADMLASASGVLIPLRTGKMSAFPLQAPGTAFSTQWTTAQIVSMTPQALPATLSPPVWRFKAGFNHNYTVQTSGLSPNVQQPRQAILAAADQFATWGNASVNAMYRRASDFAPVPTRLVSLGGAQALSATWGALWGTRRRVYSVVLPIAVAILSEIGQSVLITYPLDDLVSGRVGLIVGEQIRSADQTITYQVLI